MKKTFRTYLQEMAIEISPKYSFRFDTKKNLETIAELLTKEKIPFEIDGLIIKTTKLCYSDVAKHCIFKSKHILQ